VRGRGTWLVVAIGALALGAGEGQAAVSCGKTITKNVKLKKDLLACPGDGLVAGAANITIDLNGHRIDGQDLTGTSGVYVSGSYVNVVIKGAGRITDFDLGVELRGDNGRVKRITPKSNTRGIEVNEADDAKVRNNAVQNSAAYGISLAHAEDVEISGNEITGPNANIFSSAGLSVNAGDTHDAVIEENVVRGGPEGDWGMLINGDAEGTKVKANEFRGSSQHGIEVYDGAANTLVKKNKAIGNTFDGIVVSASAGSGTSVLGNTARDNDSDGIYIGLGGVEVGDNTANDNGAWGINAVPGVIDLGGNKAKGNGQAAECTGVTCN
jgi:parallel beta-helix repeat protein